MTNNPALLPGEVGIVYDLPQHKLSPYKDALGIVIGVDSDITFSELPIYCLPVYAKPAEPIANKYTEELILEEEDKYKNINKVNDHLLEITNPFSPFFNFN